MNKPTFLEERKLWKKGFNYVIGIDEVGRGSFAGPVVTAAVMFAKETNINLCREINDSKLLTPEKRTKLTKEIKKNCLSFAIAQSSISVINKHGVGKATEKSFRKTLNILTSKYPNIFVLVDGFHIKYLRGVGLKNQKAIVKGDRKSISIAAASIIAKVYRDNLMKKLHRQYPTYHFAKHKGYGTKEHQRAIKRYGLSKIHRTSFALEKFTV